MFSAGVLLEESQCDFSWEEVRAERDRDLAEGGWRALKDVVLSTPWRDYRQSLRDLPQNYAEANDAADAFPVKPDD